MLSKNTKILFQGDSITDGGRSRNDDLNHVMGHGYAYLVAARLGVKYPGLNLKFFNRGINGNRIVDLYARWKEDAINLAPDIISILVGVNDVGAQFYNGTGVSAKQYEKTYRMLLDDTLQALPNTSFVVCETFVLQVGEIKERGEEGVDEISRRREIVSNLAKQYDAVLVSTQNVFDVCKDVDPVYWAWDGVHPMPAGHELIAREWINTVEQENATDA